MHRPTCLVERPAARSANQRRLSLALALVGLSHVGGGAYLAWEQPGLHPSNATCAAVLVLLGLAQLQLARSVWLARGRRDAAALVRQRLFWRWMLAGLIVCYGGALLMGAERGGPQLFWVGMAAWLLAIQWPLVLDAALLERLAGLMKVRAVRRVGWLLYLAIVFPLAAEAASRLFALAFDDPRYHPFAASDVKLPPVATMAGRSTAAGGCLDEAFCPEPQPGLFRVAAVGDELVLCGEAETNFLAQLERRVPGVEICTFGSPGAGPREYAAIAAQEIARCRPDLVLAFVSIGNDIREATPPPGWFDRRQWHVYRAGTLLLGRSDPLPSVLAESLHEPQDQSGYLSESAGQLAVCRTPLDETMRSRWKEALGHLDALVRHCRRNDTAVALVLAPGAFQVDRPLCEVLRRRAGFRADQLDLELPQRRLTAFAQQRDLPMLDLLPHLAACPRPPFQRNSGSLSPSGHDLAAEALGQWIQGRYGNLVAMRTGD